MTDDRSKLPPKIARIWSGAVKTADADRYAGYIRETGFAEYGRTTGNRGAWLLQDDSGDRTEFVAFSLWDSADAIRAFAGDEIAIAVYYDKDDEYRRDRLPLRGDRRRRLSAGPRIPRRSPAACPARTPT